MKHANGQIQVHFMQFFYEAYTTENHSGMFTGKGIATVIKNHHRHLDISPSGIQSSIHHLQRSPWVAAYTSVLQPSAHHCQT
jgi:hypothetical protein